MSSQNYNEAKIVKIFGPDLGKDGNNIYRLVTENNETAVIQGRFLNEAEIRTGVTIQEMLNDAASVFFDAGRLLWSAFDPQKVMRLKPYSPPTKTVAVQVTESTWHNGEMYSPGQTVIVSDPIECQSAARTLEMVSKMSIDPPITKATPTMISKIELPQTPKNPKKMEPKQYRDFLQQIESTDAVRQREIIQQIVPHLEIIAKLLKKW
jgi:hypothetical protein